MTHQAAITSAHLEAIYRIMLTRIAKGYSAERLTYLIGKKNNYIEQVESLKLPLYPNLQLNRIAYFLEEADDKNFYATDFNETLVNVVVTRRKYQNKLVHTYSRVGEDNRKCKLFSVSEPLFDEGATTPCSSDDLQTAKDSILGLIKAKFFSIAREPSEKYQVINQSLVKPLDKLTIDVAMLSFIAFNKNYRSLSLDLM